jgi:DNA-directed RNA polymerase subunit RPC12/RpoP
MALYKCLTCKAVFLNDLAWEEHQKLVHSDEAAAAQIGCDLCDKIYASIYELNRHVKEIHAKSKIFTCSLCSSTFTRKYNCR